MTRRRTAFVMSALTALFGAYGGLAVAQEFPVHPKALTTPAAGTSDDFVKSAAVSDGFVAAWNKTTGGKTSVVIRRFAADGAQVSDLAMVEDGTSAGTPVEGRPEVVNLGGDRIGVVWMGAGPALKGAVYDATTGALSAPVVYFSSGTLANVPHDLALFENGAVAIVTRRAVFDGEDTTVFFADQTMTQVGPSQVVEHDASGLSKSGVYDHTLVRVGPNVAVIYRNVSERLKRNTYSANGDFLGSKFMEDVSRPWNEVEFRKFTVKTDNFPGGGYVVAWTNYRDDTKRLIFAQVYGRDGNVKRTTQSFGPGASTMQPDVFVFDEGYGVGWLQASEASGLMTHQIEFYKDQLDDPRIVTEYYGAHGQSGIAPPEEASNFVRLPNGDFVRLFVADGRIYGDRIPKPKLGENMSVDELKGSSGSDVIVASLAKGDVKGGDGDDIIESGRYTKLILAGKGDDVIASRGYSPESPLRIKGGAGDDIFRITGPSVEILDFKGGDRLDLSMFGYDDWKAALKNTTKVGKDLILELSPRNSPNVTKVKLIGVRKKDLKINNIMN